MTESPLPPMQDAPAAIPPPPPPVANAAGVPQATVSGRPTAAVVIGILLLIYGSLCSLSSLLGVLQLASGKVNPLEPANVQVVSLAASIMVTVFAMLCGIGLVKVLPWARKGTIRALLAILALNLSSTAWSIYFMQKMLPTMGAPTVVQTSLYGVFVLACILGGGITALFIYLLTRPQVVQAFRAAGEK